MQVLVISHLYPTPRSSTKGVYVHEQVSNYPSDVDPFVLMPISLLPPKEVFQDISNKLFPWLKGKREDLAAQGDSIARIGYMAPPKGALEHLEPTLIRLFSSRAIEGIFKKNMPDLIHAHFVFPDGYLGHLLAEKFNVPYIVTVHGSDINLLDSKSDKVKKRSLYALKNARRIIAVSNALREKLLMLGLPNGQIVTIPNGVDYIRFSLSKPIFKVKEVQEYKLLFIGTLSPIKGIDILLKAIASILSKKRLQLKLYIIGEGPLRSELEALVGSLNISGQVEFVGPVLHSEIPSWLSSVDLLVISSRNEGWPTIINEAFSCGLPIVATTVGGIPEAINSESLGLLIEPESENQLAEAILLASKKKWDKELIKQHAQKYTWNIIAARLYEEYTRALQGKELIQERKY